jgi:hypothetical protein
MAASGPIAHDSDAARWLAWARGYADFIDPTCGPPEISPQMVLGMEARQS